MKKLKNAFDLKSFNIGIIALSALLFFGTVGASLLAISNAPKASVLDAKEDIQEKIEPSYEQLLKEGDELFETRQFDEAINTFMEAISSDPSKGVGFAKLGKTYLKNADYSDALQALRKSVELNPNNSEYAVLYGEALIQNGHYESAREVFRRINDHQGSVFYNGVLAAFYEQHEEAKKYFEQAEKMNGSIPKFQIQLFKKAYETFDAQQDGQLIFLNALLTEAMNTAGEYKLAEDLAIRILNEKNDYRDVWILLGYAQLKSKQYEKAEDALKQAIHLDSLRSESHYFLAMAHFFQEEYDEAARSFELALLHGFQPEVEAYKKLAESYIALEQYDDAIAAYEYLISIDPNNLNLFVNPIWISLNIYEDLDRALSLAEQSVELFPSQAQSHSLLSWVLIKQGDLDAAAKSINMAFSIDRHLPDNFYNAGLLEEARGNLEKAKSNFKKAFDLSLPENIIHEMAAEHYNALINLEPASE